MNTRRRRSSVTTSNATSHVRVAVRVRKPEIEFENDGRTTRPHCVAPVPDSDSAIEYAHDNQRKTFTYDHVLGIHASQMDVYETAVQPLLTPLLNGYNVTVIAYGQTGSGKTFTMGSNATVVNKSPVASPRRNSRVPSVAPCFPQGASSELGGFQDAPDDGLIPRFLSDIFANLKREPSVRTLRVSFLELYCDTVRDLLDNSPHAHANNLVIRDDANSVYVDNLRQHQVDSLSKALDLLNSGRARQMTASTALNDTSSRSHAIYTMEITRKFSSEIKKSNVTFVDLAGSERLKKTKVEGVRKKESIHINGLLALSNVINTLADEKKIQRRHSQEQADTAKAGSPMASPKPPSDGFVPYRSSKLTHLLRDALGGNSRTLFIACVSPLGVNADETLSTLQYANRARNIQNKAEQRVEMTLQRTPSQMEMVALQVEVTNLKQKVATLTAAAATVAANHQREKDEIRKNRTTRRDASVSTHGDDAYFAQPTCDVQVGTDSVLSCDASIETAMVQTRETETATDTTTTHDVQMCTDEIQLKDAQMHTDPEEVSRCERVDNETQFEASDIMESDSAVQHKRLLIDCAQRCAESYTDSQRSIVSNSNLDATPANGINPVTNAMSRSQPGSISTHINKAEADGGCTAAMHSTANNISLEAQSPFSHQGPIHADELASAIPTLVRLPAQISPMTNASSSTVTFDRASSSSVQTMAEETLLHGDFLGSNSMKKEEQILAPAPSFPLKQTTSLISPLELNPPNAEVNSAAAMIDYPEKLPLPGPLAITVRAATAVDGVNNDASNDDAPYNINSDLTSITATDEIDLVHDEEKPDFTCCRSPALRSLTTSQTAVSPVKVTSSRFATTPLRPMKLFAFDDVMTASPSEKTLMQAEVVIKNLQELIKAEYGNNTLSMDQKGAAKEENHTNALTTERMVADAERFFTFRRRQQQRITRLYQQAKSYQDILLVDPVPPLLAGEEAREMYTLRAQEMLLTQLVADYESLAAQRIIMRVSARSEVVISASSSSAMIPHKPPHQEEIERLDPTVPREVFLSKEQYRACSNWFESHRDDREVFQEQIVPLLLSGWISVTQQTLNAERMWLQL